MSRNFFFSSGIIQQAAQLTVCESICSFCSRMKRGRLYACARRGGYNVLAMGQHLDDLAERFVASLGWGGRGWHNDGTIGRARWRRITVCDYWHFWVRVLDSSVVCILVQSSSSLSLSVFLLLILCLFILQKLYFVVWFLSFEDLTERRYKRYLSEGDVAP